MVAPIGSPTVVSSAWWPWPDKEAARMFQGDDCQLAKREGWTLEKNAKFGELK